jgi:Uma2 family endonuclease
MAAREKATLEYFKQFVEQPENADRLFELIDGEIVEKMPGTTRNSGISMILGSEVHIFCKQNQLPGYVTGEAGTYLVVGHVVAPDFAFKQTPTTSEYPDPVVPLWVAEVISPNDKPHDIRAKRTIYLQAGILYWEIYPDEQSVDVYAPGEAVRTYNIADTLEVGALLPGFSLTVRDLFE